MLSSLSSTSVRVSERVRKKRGCQRAAQQLVGLPEGNPNNWYQSLMARDHGGRDGCGGTAL
jgi:hypothetical protein